MNHSKIQGEREKESKGSKSRCVPSAVAYVLGVVTATPFLLIRPGRMGVLLHPIDNAAGMLPSRNSSGR